MIGVDTNVLVRYVVRDDEQQYAAAAGVLESFTEDEPGFITQVVLAELSWVLARAYRYPAAARLAVIRGLVATASLEFDDAEGLVRALELAEGGRTSATPSSTGAMVFGVRDTVTFDRSCSRVGLAPARFRPDRTVTRVRRPSGSCSPCTLLLEVGTSTRRQVPAQSPPRRRPGETTPRPRPPPTLSTESAPPGRSRDEGPGPAPRHRCVPPPGRHRLAGRRQ